MMFHSRVLSIQPRIAIFFIAVYIFSELCLFSNSLASTFPQDLDYSNRIEVLLDKGELWNVNSIFHPLDISRKDSTSSHLAHQDAFNWVRSYLDEYSCLAFHLKKSSSSGLSALLLPGIGLSVQSGAARHYEKLALQPFIWSEARFRYNWYARLYIRATNESASLTHFSGISRSISRASMNTGEIDQSVIGYQNRWVQIEYGRNREIWGPMVEENLILSGNAPSWERLMIQGNHRCFTYRWFFGFLEAIQNTDNIQRYIVGRALEYNNQKNFILGIGEVSILAGPNRSLDLAYLNPLTLHLEVEQNDRCNHIDNYQNAIWFLHLDWLVVHSLRLNGSILIDEIKLERQEIREGDTENLGWWGRVAWTPTTDKIGITFFSSYLRINTYTMQHTYPYCNFVTRNQLLGHPLGNDADQINAGMRITTMYLPGLLELEYGRIRWGDNSLRFSPYRLFEEFSRVPFPSGQVRTNRYILVKLNSQLSKGLSVNIEGHIDLKHSGEDSALEVWTFTVRYQIPFFLTNI
ncbi:MAG: capsule assembly Wzi family protein [Candidatus Hatepunaea meridiana]|nr:capsule assembly Wzi family protein [Candidatus Hatepunaea meridiana]